MRKATLTVFAILLTAPLGLARPAPQEPPRDQQKNAPGKSDKKKDKGQEDALDTSVFSEGVAGQVLGALRDGLEGHSQRRMLAVFDADKMDGYLTFEDQVQAFFDRYEAFRVHFRIAQTTVEGSRGVVLVDFEMEEIPRGGNQPPLRKNSQVRFEFERGRKGWKIVDFRPRGFFA